MPSDCHISDVQGNSLDVLGAIEVPITVNNKTIVWKLLIIDMLSEECIIGSDFMAANDISINFGARQIFF